MFSCVLHTRKMILRNVDLLGKGHTFNKQLRGKSLAPICLQSLGPLHIPNGKGYLGSKPWIASHSKIIKQGITHNFIPCIRTLLLLMPVRCNKCLCDQEEVIKERGRISGRRKRKHSHGDPKATWSDVIIPGLVGSDHLGAHVIATDLKHFIWRSLLIWSYTWRGWIKTFKILPR